MQKSSQLLNPFYTLFCMLKFKFHLFAYFLLLDSFSLILHGVFNISILCDRYWVTEMHVDGFRFDLASIMTRGSRQGSRLTANFSDDIVFNLYWRLIFVFLNCDCTVFMFSTSLWDSVNVYGIPIEGDLLTTGTPLSSPPLIDLISNDPILRGVKVFFLNFFSTLLYKLWSFILKGIQHLLDSFQVS